MMTALMLTDADADAGHACLDVAENRPLVVFGKYVVKPCIRLSALRPLSLRWEILFDLNPILGLDAEDGE
jgi:hypothetical protein